jgi:Protein of unknown function (DUF3800)
MWLAYFDENKYDPAAGRNHFWIGGVLVPESAASALDKRLRAVQTEFFGTSVLAPQSELHGKELFHGKGNCKSRTLPERLKVFDDVAQCMLDLKLPLRFVSMDVPAHRAKYKSPEPEYRLGLMLLLERYCEFLETQGDNGLVFCDYEADEIAQSMLDFSVYKQVGATRYWKGRSLDRIHDTIYFTPSHHSRFIQAADLLIYLAARYDAMTAPPEKWHEAQAWSIWQKIKASAVIQHWP